MVIFLYSIRVKVIVYCLSVYIIQKDHAKKYKSNTLAKILSQWITISEREANTHYWLCGVKIIFLAHHLQLKYQQSAKTWLPAHFRLNLSLNSFSFLIYISMFKHVKPESGRSLTFCTSYAAQFNALQSCKNFRNWNTKSASSSTLCVKSYILQFSLTFIEWTSWNVYLLIWNQIKSNHLIWKQSIEFNLDIWLWISVHPSISIMLFRVWCCSISQLALPTKKLFEFHCWTYTFTCRLMSALQFLTLLCPGFKNIFYQYLIPSETRFMYFLKTKK